MLAAILAVGQLVNKPGRPTVRQIERWFVSALGGTNAIMGPKSMTIRADYVAYGPNGQSAPCSMRLYVAQLKDLIVISVPRKGETRIGCNRTLGWRQSPGRPPVVYDHGPELDSMRRDADQYYWAHILKYFRSMAVMGAKTFHGHPCYRLQGVTKWGKTNNLFFDVRTHLLDGYESSNNGVRTEQVLSDYRDFHDLKIPMKTTTYQSGKLVNVIRYRRVSFNDVPETMFVPPREVLKKQPQMGVAGSALLHPQGARE